MKRVIRRGPSFPIVRRACSCLLGILLLLSSLFLLALSWICRHMRCLFSLWLVLVTVGQVKDFLQRHPHDDSSSSSFHETKKSGLQFSDLFFPHRKFVHHLTMSSSKPVWKTTVRCNNHTIWTLPHWLHQDPLETSSVADVCESEFLWPRSVLRRRSSPPFQPSKRVQVILMIGEPSPVSSTASPAPFFMEQNKKNRFRHLWNETSMQVRIHPNVRWTGLNIQDETKTSDTVVMERNQWLGEPIGESNDFQVWHPSILQFGYIASHFVGPNSPLWLLHIPEQSVASIVESSRSSSTTTDSHAASTPWDRQQPPLLTMQDSTRASSHPAKKTSVTKDEPSSAERQRLLQTQRKNGSNSLAIWEEIQRVLDHLHLCYPGITHDKYDVLGIVWWPRRRPHVPSNNKGAQAIVTEYETYLSKAIERMRDRLSAPVAKVLLVDDNVHAGSTQEAAGTPSNHDHLWQQALQTVSADSRKYPAFQGNVQSLRLPFGKMGTDLSVEQALVHGTALGWNMARLLGHRPAAPNR